MHILVSTFHINSSKHALLEKVFAEVKFNGCGFLLMLFFFFFKLYPTGGKLNLIFSSGTEFSSGGLSPCWHLLESASANS